jgi:nucleoside-diphosphate-sugar epimerase
MPSRVFVTGISGYIGGQFVVDLSRKHPHLQIVGLVRNDEQVRQIKSKLPSIQTVQGDLSSHEILLEEAKRADIVIQVADCDDVPAVKTLIKGLSQGGKGGSYIQVSGAASIVDNSNGYGSASTRVYDDIKDIEEITTLDSSHLHSDADQAVIREGEQQGVKTALLVPVMVYGKGEGPAKTTSMVLKWLEEAISKHGKAFTVGEGKNSWGGVHVKDVSSVMILVLEDALRPDPKMTWGTQAVYYVSDGDYVLGDIVLQVADILKKKGLQQSGEVDSISADEANSLHPYGAFLWGTNCRCNASRLHQIGWKPTQPTLFDVLSKRLEDE